MKKKSQKSRLLSKSLVITSAAVLGVSAIAAATSQLKTSNLVSDFKNLGSGLETPNVANQPITVNESSQTQLNRNGQEKANNGTTVPLYDVAKPWSDASFSSKYAYEFFATPAEVENYLDENKERIFENAYNLAPKCIHYNVDSLIINDAEGYAILDIYFTQWRLNGNVVDTESSLFKIKFTGFKALHWNYGDGNNKLYTFFRWKSQTKNEWAFEILAKLKAINERNIETNLRLISDYLGFGPLPYRLPDFRISIDGVANNAEGVIDLVIKTNAVFSEFIDQSTGKKITTISKQKSNDTPFIFKLSSRDTLTLSKKGLTKIELNPIDMTKVSDPNLVPLLNTKDFVSSLENNTRLKTTVQEKILAQIIPPIGINYTTDDIDIQFNTYKAEPETGIYSVDVIINNFISENDMGDKTVRITIQLNPLAVPTITKSPTYPMLYDVNDAIELIKQDLRKQNYAEQKFIQQFLSVAGIDYTKTKVINFVAKNVDTDANKAQFFFTFKDIPNIVPNQPSFSNVEVNFEYQFYTNKIETRIEPEITLSSQDKINDTTFASEMYPYKVAEKQGQHYINDEKLRTFLLEKAIINKAIIDGNGEISIDPNAYSIDDIEIKSIANINNAKGSIQVTFELKRYVEYDWENKPTYHDGTGTKKAKTTIYGFKKAYSETTFTPNPSYINEFKNKLPSELAAEIETASQAQDLNKLLELTKKLLSIYSHPYTNANGEIIDDQYFKDGKIDIQVVNKNDQEGWITLKFYVRGKFNNNETFSFVDNKTFTDPIKFHFLETLPNRTQITKEVHVVDNVYVEYLAQDFEQQYKANPTFQAKTKEAILKQLRYYPQGFTVDNIVEVRVQPGAEHVNNDGKWVDIEVVINNYYDGQQRDPITPDQNKTTTLTTRFFANFRNIKPTRFRESSYRVKDVKEFKPSDWLKANGVSAIIDIIDGFMQDNANTNIVIGDIPPQGLKKQDIVIDEATIKTDDKSGRITFEAALKNFWDYDEATGVSELKNDPNGYSPKTRMILSGFHSQDITIIPGDNSKFPVSAELSKFYPSDLSFNHPAYGAEDAQFTLKKLQDFIWDPKNNIIEGKFPEVAGAIIGSNNVKLQNKSNFFNIDYLGIPNDKEGELVVKIHLDQVKYVDEASGNVITGDPSKDPNVDPEYAKTLQDFTIILTGFSRRIPTTINNQNVQSSQVSAEFNGKLPTEIQVLNQNEGTIYKEMYDLAGNKLLKDNVFIQGHYPTTIVKPQQSQNFTNPDVQLPAFFATRANAFDQIAPENRVAYNEVINPNNLDGTYDVHIKLDAFYDSSNGLLRLVNVDQDFVPLEADVHVVDASDIKKTDFIPDAEINLRNPELSKITPQEWRDIITNNNPKDKVDIFKNAIFDQVVTGGKKDITIDDLVIEVKEHDNLKGTLSIEIKLNKFWDENGLMQSTTTPGVIPLVKPIVITDIKFTGITIVKDRESRTIKHHKILSQWKVGDYINRMKEAINGTTANPDIIEEFKKTKEVVWDEFIKPNPSYTENMDTKNLIDIEIGQLAGTNDTAYVKFKLSSYWDKKGDWTTQPSQEYEVYLSGFKTGNSTELIDFPIVGKKYSDEAGGLYFGEKKSDVTEIPPSVSHEYEWNSIAHLISPQAWVDGVGQEKAKELLKKVLVMNQNQIIINAPSPFEESNIRDVSIDNNGIDNAKGEIRVTYNLVGYLDINGKPSSTPKDFTVVISGFGKIGATKYIDANDIDIQDELLQQVQENKIIPSSISLVDGKVMSTIANKDLTEPMKQFLRDHVVTGYAPPKEITKDDIVILSITNQNDLTKQIRVKFGLKKYYDATGALQDDPTGQNFTKEINLNNFFAKLDAQPTIPPTDIWELKSGINPEDTDELFKYFYNNSFDAPSKESNIFIESVTNSPGNANEAKEHLKAWILRNTTGTKDGITNEHIEIIDLKPNLLAGSISVQYRLKQYWTSAGPAQEPSQIFSLTITGFKEGKVTDVTGNVGSFFNDKQGLTEAFLNEGRNQELINLLKNGNAVDKKPILLSDILNNSSKDISRQQLADLVISFIYNNIVGDTDYKLIKNPLIEGLTKECIVLDDTLPVENQMVQDGGKLIVHLRLANFYDEEGNPQKLLNNDHKQWKKITIVLDGFPSNKPTKLKSTEARLNIAQKTGPSTTQGKIPTYYLEMSSKSKDGKSEYFWKDSTASGLISDISAKVSGLSNPSDARNEMELRIKEFIIDNLIIESGNTLPEDIKLDISYNDPLGFINVTYTVQRGNVDKEGNGIYVPGPITLVGSLQIFGFVPNGSIKASNLIVLLTYSLTGVGVFCLLAIILFIVYRRRRDIEYRQ